MNAMCRILLALSAVVGAASYEEVKVGILHSVTGAAARGEKLAINAELLAIDEINEAGGLLGHKVVPVMADGASDPDTFAREAESLTNPESEQYTKVVFGGWTSDSRKAMLPVFERNDHMLFYPLQYEGQECSKTVFYTGAVPNQQTNVAVEWLFHNKGRHFFLVGSDYVYPRTTNAVIKPQIEALGGKVVREMYLPSVASDAAVGEVLAEIRRTLPHGGVILNTINGDVNGQFFKMLHDEGMSAKKWPVMSTSVGMPDVAVWGPVYFAGHYVARNYVMTIRSDTNKRFVEAYQAKYGERELTTDSMEAAYTAVHLWAKAVRAAGTFAIKHVREAVVGQGFHAPEGLVIMRENHHLSKPLRIAKISEEGWFYIKYDTEHAIYPQPWSQWLSFSHGRACDWTDPRKGGFYLRWAEEQEGREYPGRKEYL